MRRCCAVGTAEVTNKIQIDSLARSCPRTSDTPHQVRSARGRKTGRAGTPVAWAAGKEDCALGDSGCTGADKRTELSNCEATFLIAAKRSLVKATGLEYAIIAAQATALKWLSLDSALPASHCWLLVVQMIDVGATGIAAPIGTSHPGAASPLGAERSTATRAVMASTTLPSVQPIRSHPYQPQACNHKADGHQAGHGFQSSRRGLWDQADSIATHIAASTSSGAAGPYARTTTQLPRSMIPRPVVA